MSACHAQGLGGSASQRRPSTSLWLLAGTAKAQISLRGNYKPSSETANDSSLFSFVVLCSSVLSWCWFAGLICNISMLSCQARTGVRDRINLEAHDEQ